LLIEAADSTLRYDRTVKLPLYAQAGVPEVWIVNVEGKTLEVHQQPVDGLYQQRQQLEELGEITPIVLPEVKLELKNLFG